MPKPEKGYTLVELLVVISILSLLSVTSFVYWRSLSSDRVVLKAIDNIQTLIRTAQSNATSGFSCAGVRGATIWSIRYNFANKNKIDLLCNTSTLVKSLVLDNVNVNAIELDGINCTNTASGTNFETTCSNIATTSDFTADIIVSYLPLTGKVQISGSGEGGSCLINVTSLRVKLKNTNSDSSKCFFVSNGGAINVQ